MPLLVCLFCAMNPCRWGYHGDPRRECHCTPYQIQNYISKISGPLLDRIDIHVEVQNVQYKDLTSEATGVSSEEIREEVTKAREIQLKRFQGLKYSTNSRMSAKTIKKHCALDSQAEELLHQAMTELNISARGYNKILKVGRPIADLDQSENVRIEHISEAVQYRNLDRDLWKWFCLNIAEQQDNPYSVFWQDHFADYQLHLPIITLLEIQYKVCHGTP